MPTPAVENHYPDFPDPFVLQDAHPSYLAASTNSDLIRMPTVAATDLGEWSEAGELLDKDEEPNWVGSQPGFWWAPAVWHNTGADEYVLYYTAREAGSNPRQCIGAATSSSPQGPYTVEPPFENARVVCDANTGSIDPSVFVDTGGQAWLLWKRDGNCCGAESDIWARRLASDGTLMGAKERLIGVSQAWEFGTNAHNTTVEGPSMAKVGADYYLFYSGSDWRSSKYAVGYAKCTAPTGGCTKPQDGPILASGPNGNGPGGGEVFVDHGGQRWLAYHAWNPGKPIGDNGERRLHLTKLGLAGGPPSFGSGP